MRNTQTFPKADINSTLYQALRIKNVTLSSLYEGIGVDWKGEIYKVTDDIAKKL